MYTSLSLSNFKSWRAIRQMRLAPITVLFGTNSSGKTSIIQLLLLMKQTAESPDRGQVLNLGDARTRIALGSFRDVVHGHDTARQLSWTISWEEPEALEISDPERKGQVLFRGEDLAFSVDVSATQQTGRPTVDRMEYSIGTHSFSMRRKTGSKYELRASANGFRFKRSLGRKWDLPEPVKFYGFPDQVRAYFQNAGFLSDLELALESQLAETYYLGPLREYPQRQYTWSGGQPEDVGPKGERVVEAILASRARNLTVSKGYRRRRRSLEEHVALWLRDLGLVHSFSVRPISKDSDLYQIHVQKSEGSADVLITDVGFGVSQILPILVLCSYVPEGSVILLEQPEIHLHPAVQAGLADVLVETVRSRDVQVIVESHSEYLLQRLQRRIAEQAVRPEEAALYFCDVTQGESRLKELEVDVFGNIRDWPKDFFGDSLGELAAMTEAAAERQAATEVRAR